MLLILLILLAAIMLMPFAYLAGAKRQLEECMEHLEDATRMSKAHWKSHVDVSKRTWLRYL